MVNLYIYGLDQFVVGDVSVGLTESLAKLYEISEDDINFVAPNDMVFHKGVEQTSWRVIVEVKAPEQLEKLQAQAKEVIFHYLSEVKIEDEFEGEYVEGEGEGEIFTGDIFENIPNFKKDDDPDKHSH